MPYDRLVELAFARGIGVDFNVGAPGPRWAMARGAPDARFATHWYPSASQFGRFVNALGRRYSGRFQVGGQIVPRVSFWSVWNKPNQPGWLAPAVARRRERSRDGSAGSLPGLRQRRLPRAREHRPRPG